jgi:target of EGR1 protein 1
MKRVRTDAVVEDAIDEGNLFNICEVNRYNLDVVTPVLLSAAKSCDFMALDTEFSGLDSGPEFKSPVLDVRYTAMRAMVARYALLQIGLSFFRRKSDQSGWHSVSFTFHLVCMSPYVIAPHSMIFLAENGVSLTDVFKRGLQFTPPSNGENASSTNDKLLQLWRDLASFHKPLVLHNGMADLMFVWRSFFGVLPPSSAEWIANMSSVFVTVYDTKYISSNVVEEEASYLQHLFRTFLARKTVSVDCVLVPLEFQVLSDCSLAEPPTEICRQYARHGNCKFGLACSRSHDVDFIVHTQEAHRTSAPVTRKSRPNNFNQRNLQKPQLSHSAGFDAFATAFVFAAYMEKLGQEKMSESANHVYLMWSDRPMLFVKSKYI